MRKLIVLSFISLDGVMQAPGGPDEDRSGGFDFGGWVAGFWDDFIRKIMAEQMKQPFHLLLGRKTFEIFASYWPQHESEWPGINDATKYVVSNTINSHSWKNSVFISGDVVGKIKELKAENGPGLQVHGSSNLIQTLLKHDLVDEFWLKIFPLTLGPGKRLFGQGAIPAGFRLLESKTSNAGVIVATYERAGEVKTGSFVQDDPIGKV
ncbi:MAG TPA: dihydrofolate reductase family protein [Terriglobales bacterium]|nr:dihydrofolate reductase family protein [Terriglobales bacterium]